MWFPRASRVRGGQLASFYERTAPVIDHYRAQGLVLPRPRPTPQPTPGLRCKGVQGLGEGGRRRGGGGQVYLLPSFPLSVFSCMGPEPNKSLHDVRRIACPGNTMWPEWDPPCDLCPPRPHGHGSRCEGVQLFSRPTPPPYARVLRVPAAAHGAGAVGPGHRCPAACDGRAAGRPDHRPALRSPAPGCRNGVNQTEDFNQKKLFPPSKYRCPPPFGYRLNVTPPLFCEW